MTLGFGPYHTEETRRLANGIAALIDIPELRNEASLRAAIDGYVKEVGNFKSEKWGHKNWSILNFKYLYLTNRYSSMPDEHFGCVVRGAVTHYNENHPFSPDGLAAMTQEFCITYEDDRNFGKQVFISV